MREYTLELPIIHSLPFTVYDRNITRDMIVDRVWFGYKSYGDVGSDIHVDTRDGCVKLTGYLKRPVQMTIKFRRSYLAEDIVHPVPRSNVYDIYHPREGNNDRCFNG